jgi:hypothetical protein
MTSRLMLDDVLDDVGSRNRKLPGGLSPMRSR